MGENDKNWELWDDKGTVNQGQELLTWTEAVDEVDRLHGEGRLDVYAENVVSGKYYEGKQ